MKSSEVMILAVIYILAIAQGSLQIQDFNGVWIRDLAMPVQRSNQLSYEATGIGTRLTSSIYQWHHGSVG